MKKLILCVLFACLFLCGCTGAKHIKTELTEYETEELQVRAEIPVLNGLTNHELEQQLNTAYQAEVHDWIQDFEERVHADLLKPQEKPKLEVKQTVKENKSGFLSFVTEKYVAISQAAHGNLWWNAKNIDMDNGCQIKLDDLFTDEKYKSFVDRKLTEMIEAHPDKYQDLWEQPKLGERQQHDFYIQDEKLVIFYQPYELSYYARGVVEFPIKMEELRGYLKAEYGQRLGGYHVEKE